MATQALGEAEIIERLARLNGWERQGGKLVKTFRLPSYMAGLALATTIGTIAEGFDHHPDLSIGYKKVTVEFTTHDAGNQLSEKDFAAATAIDALPYPRA
ncbi:MAG: 4a-hydroxytetrahydrobiopterin dehydratase [Anaerolineae bacterium]|nr:4a-hydroxytetrahydrobiopterin dehydratase [Anaerolineae bacterium]